MSKQRLMIIDDEKDMLQGLSRILPQELENIQVETFSSALSGLESIKRQPVDVLLLDIRMPEMDGMEVLTAVKEIDPWITVVMITAYGSIETAVEAIKKGAYDFITKPFEIPDLVRVLNKALERSLLIRENMNLRKKVSEKEPFADFVGQSPPMRRLYDGIQALAGTDYTVLIRGESGTGKELVARALHELSPRSSRRMVTVNCPAIPEHLLESELFGHKKGAFTGAEQNHTGMFLEADKSTLLLDEIGDLPVSIQTKLLRVLQEREVRPLGSDKSRKVDVRILSCTNQDLEARIQDRSFREDLYYRLNVVTLRTPSLSEITEDIPLLADHFLRSVCNELGLPLKRFSVAAIQSMMHKSWPGNVRELQNFVRRVALFSPEEEIGAADIRVAQDSLYGSAESRQDQDSNGKAVKPYQQAKEELLENFTREYITRLLGQTEGNVTRASDIAGISRTALQKIMRRYEIRSEDYR
ncbi:two component, sigma54 specific, transcriptional regulator, Fis family [Desulfonatronospira thiodismutans ASO3-1]|uniref:Two component, sigma54 specific, transcriptional regulator, Fis family n=1 Tax=Desulfonatronospira thiodismutans ASO3-1 TaxID=555779 RepID=D6SKK9_9BACT|nr:sigma-54 dependent transcriptional regulator [Desulfonatronospira thiodismutans]EFI35220.1 two component, sigma54 specific, transcriptional regulator, Fis family [Desulfonatronospira thiodismutans ASO3-1]